MKLLLHMCCGPCSTYSTRRFRELGYELQGYFYNPNIHPYKEFRRRLEALETFCRDENIPLTVCREYELEQYLEQAVENLENRCRFCYRFRLDKAAKTAAMLGIPRFSTTLAISPYQNHDLLRLEGETAGKKYGVEFIYEDLRPGYRESVEISKQMNLYRQPYCGCIFSEKERYYKEAR
ncbi:MAG: epoxyqueuosine reductase QueH [Bacillota bacterium]|nr:epoxyqueuosine reductase QueH [Bacillota bacterium]MDW7682487.1 epoxyqueuosine reductase QueH [Bacillota bacterium]